MTNLFHIKRLRDLETLMHAICVVLGLMAALRITAIVLSDGNGIDVFFAVRQVVTFLLLLSFINFFLKLAEFSNFHQINCMRLISATMIAMIACFAKLVVSAIYLYPYISDNLFATGYNILELCVWLLLGLFFLSYWLYRKNKLSK